METKEKPDLEKYHTIFLLILEMKKQARVRASLTRGHFSHQIFIHEMTTLVCFPRFEKSATKRGHNTKIGGYFSKLGFSFVFQQHSSFQKKGSKVQQHRVIFLKYFSQKYQVRVSAALIGGQFFDTDTHLYIAFSSLFSTYVEVQQLGVIAPNKGVMSLTYSFQSLVLHLMSNIILVSTRRGQSSNCRGSHY